MVEIIMEALVQKIYRITAENVKVDLYRNGTNLWMGIRPVDSKKFFHKDLLEEYETVEEVDKAAEVLVKNFVCEYIGEDLK